MKLKDLMNKFRRRGKIVVPSIHALPPKHDPSIITVFRSKKKFSKLSLKNLDLLEGKNVPDLLKKYPLSPSKTKALDKMVKDYRKGNLSLPGSTTSKYKNKKLNKEKLSKLIEDYEEAKKKTRKSVSLKIIDNLKSLNVAELKKKFSWTSSKGKLFDQLIDDYGDKKISLSKLSHKSNFDPKTMSREKINKLLNDYEDQKKRMKMSVSELKTVISLLSAKQPSKLISLESLKSLAKYYFGNIDKVK